jgi:hypothetical protein
MAWRPAGLEREPLFDKCGYIIKQLVAKCDSSLPLAAESRWWENGAEQETIVIGKKP